MIRQMLPLFLSRSLTSKNCTFFALLFAIVGLRQLIPVGHSNSIKLRTSVYEMFTDDFKVTLVLNVYYSLLNCSLTFFFTSFRNPFHHEKQRFTNKLVKQKQETQMEVGVIQQGEALAHYTGFDSAAAKYLVLCGHCPCKAMVHQRVTPLPSNAYVFSRSEPALNYRSFIPLSIPLREPIKYSHYQYMQTDKK